MSAARGQAARRAELVSTLGGEMRKDLLALVMGTAVIVGGACSWSVPIAVPPRPPGVPSAAVWAGGEDGGSWIHCVLRKGRDWCVVYAESGEREAEGYFGVPGMKGPVSPSELHFNAFDGTSI